MEDTHPSPPENSCHEGGDGGSRRATALRSSETKWIIASGSLESSITFDSSQDDDSPAESDSPPESTPLILKPPSPDSGPCEIKLYLTHKYNIRQIYVRSTARTFEIYHSQSQHVEEYLCTARCSVAVRDDEVLQAKFSEESFRDTAIKPSLSGSDEKETIASSEDDWVDVKALDCPLPEDGAQPVLNKINCCMEGVVQDYYEATVEISDSEPCALVKIRFLSLQSKDFVFIDEIYVFDELVGPIQSGSQAPDVTRSAGNPLMAMLFPAILELPKSRANEFQAEELSDKMGKLNKVEILSNSTEFTDVAPRILQDISVPDQQYLKLPDSEILKRVKNLEVLSEVTEIPQDENANADHQYVKLQDLDKCTSDKCTTGSVHTQIHGQNLAGHSSSDPLVTRDSPYHRIDKVLEQLVSRVSRIEEVFLRFEENMLKPINRMDMRLQRVEEHLESLAKQSDSSGLPAGSRFSAPFYCNSNSSLIHKDGSDGQSLSRKLTLDKEPSSSSDLLNTFEGVPDSVKPPRLLPSLMVTAPEFSCIEDDQDADGIEPFKENNQDAGGIEPIEGNNQDADVSKSFTDSPEIKPRSCLIDDVLSAALSNFLLSSRDNASEHKRTSISDYGASQIFGNEMSSQNAETHNSSAQEVTANVSDHEEPPKYTQILTITAPEFTSGEIGGEDDSDLVQLPSEEASPPPKTDGIYLVPLSVFENDLVEVTSETSHCAGKKSAFNQLSMTGDLCSETVQNQFFKKYSLPWWLDGSSSSSTYEAEISVRTDCESVKEADQRDSTTFPLSPGKREFLEKNLFESAAETEEKDLLDKFFELGIGDATADGNSSPQTSPMTILDHQLPRPQHNFTTNSPKESGDVDFNADGYKFIEFEGNDFIDPQTSERLLLELGIYDNEANIQEESSGSVGSHITRSNQEMLASLI